MGGRIHGNLSTDDQCIEGVTNNGGIQEADNDLTDNGGPGPSPTGSVDVAQFPATAPGLGDQLAAAQERAECAPSGDDPTPQVYCAEVPFSGTALTLGAAASAGGAGASLTTGGNVFVGATGTLALQSMGVFTGQTKATMGLYAAAGVTAHAQDKFEIYAGGGLAPGACGSGGPAGTKKTGKPGEAAEKWTGVACNVLGVVKGLNDLRNAHAGWKGAASDYATAAKGVTDVLNKGAAVGMAVAGTDKDTAKTVGKWGDTTSGVLGAIGGLTKMKEDPVGALSSVLSGLSSVSGAQGGTGFLNAEKPVKGAAGAAPPGAAGAGPLSIEKRAAAKIHQSCNVKVTGNAPEGIDWKVGGAYIVNAVTAVDFATTNWGAFAAYQFKVRAVGLIDVKCRRFEMKALASGTVKTLVTTVTASSKSVLDGDTKVTQTFTVLKHTTLHDALHADDTGKATVVKGNLTVKKDATHQDDAKLHKLCKLKGDVTVNGRWTSKSSIKAASEGKFG
jgi:hypothetical protein